MTGKMSKKSRFLGGWLIAILLEIFLPAPYLFAQTGQISFSEAPPEVPFDPFTPNLMPWCVEQGEVESFHSTQCFFPPASALTPREPAKPGPSDPGPARQTGPAAANGVAQASCSSCSAGLGWNTRGGCSGCNSAGRLPCYPGRKPCCGGDDCQAAPPPQGCFGRFLYGVYECLCCPDPCYEGKWTPIADSAFHVAAPRPITQQRLRWNAGLDVVLADRSEFFWARADGGAGARGVKPPAGSAIVDHFRFNDLSYYFEAAAGMFSIFTEVPYRSMDLPEGASHYAGFGDIKVGMKTMLFDCELLQVSTQLITYTPSGIASKGLGVGHVSLEPSLLLGVRLGPDTYFQHQLSEWIPLGGDQEYAGAVLHTHSSVNHVLYRFRPDVPLIGTAEFNSWSFQDGAFTDPVLGPFQGSSGTTYCSAGPGLRLFICDRIDFGFAASFALTNPHLWGELYSTEFRWRF